MGGGFVTLYTLAYAGATLLLLAPLLVSLALKVNGLVGLERAPASLALVTGVGSLLAMVSNPLFGRLSDRTASSLGMRRPWMLIGLAGGSLGILTVALAPTIPVVLLGWCVAQVFFNALLAATVAVLPDQVPVQQRGAVSGILAVCLPAASVVGTFLVQRFDDNDLTMLLAPCVLGGLLVLLLAVRLDDRTLDPDDRPAWSWRELAGTFYVDPRRNPDFAWAFASRFMLVMAYAFLTTYQAYYLLAQVGISEDQVAHQIYVGTVVQSVALVVAATGQRQGVGPARPTQGVRLRRGDPLRRWLGRHRERPHPGATCSAWGSAASASGCTWPSTSLSSSTSCLIRLPPRRTSGS